MPAKTIARAGALSDTPDEDYQAVCQALSAGERGRAFLAEYARRNRNADTEQLRAAIGQLQSLVALQGTPQTTEPVKRQLRALLDEITTAQCELEARLLATKAAKLAELVALVESRISQILKSFRADPAPKVETRRRRLIRMSSQLKTPNDPSRGCASPRAARIANSLAIGLPSPCHCSRAQRDRHGRSRIRRNAAGAGRGECRSVERG